MTKVWYAKKPVFSTENVTIESMKETHLAIPHEFNNEKTLDAIWMILNDYATNPLSAENGGQGWLIENNMHHTSMSIGDIIERDGKFYICADEGWETL